MRTRTSTILLTFLAFLSAGECAIQGKAHSMPAQSAYTVRDFVLQTVDGIAIGARLYDANNDDVIVYCHRLLRGKESGEVDLLAKTLTDEYDLITFDFRGHKSSFGTTTVGGVSFESSIWTQSVFLRCALISAPFFLRDCSPAVPCCPRIHLPREATVASVVVFSAPADTPVLRGHREWRRMARGDWTGWGCRASPPWRGYCAIPDADAS